MEKKTLKQRIKQNPALKKAVHRFIMHPVKTRPNWWIRLFYFVYLKRGKGSVIYRSVRKDLPPFNQFSLGCYSVVEDFCCLNNAVGDLFIGDYTRIGLGNTLIGPVRIGNHVNLAQNITVTGLNHNYQDAEKLIDEQGVSTQPVTIEDDRSKFCHTTGSNSRKTQCSSCRKRCQPLHPGILYLCRMPCKSDQIL